MAYTNSGLVAYCKQALLKKTAYMWGGIFREITDSYISQLSVIPAYKSQYPASRVTHLKSLVGKDYYGCDCVGLIKSYYFGGIGVKANAPGYDSSKDYGVGSMYDAAKVKGSIATLPEKPGLCVITADKGHIGVYIGNGEVIECTLGSKGDGVVKTKMPSNWAFWCQCPFIIDDSTAKPTTDAKTTECKKIYKSLGIARKRASASLTSAEKGRCARGEYYLATQLATPTGSSQTWFKHLDGTYSAITDTNAAKLFKAIGTYSTAKANAVANVRAGAGINNSVIGKISPGETVYVVASAGTRTANGLTWVQVVYSGRLCWVDRQWVNM